MAHTTKDSFGLSGETLADKYVIEAAVAEGGFGIVYRARHRELQTPLAIKVLRVPSHYQGDLRTQFLDKFRLEARTIAALNHASIVRVIDFGLTAHERGELPWMALEWLDGKTLESDLRQRRGQRSRGPDDVLALMRPVFDALACAHEAGIAHRDIKPANLMLVRARRGETSLRVLDFGIAKVMEPAEAPGTGDTATLSDLSAFSPFYGAPEQLSRARTGPWTDVHALAMLMTELLVDEAPYRADDVTQACFKIVDRERPTPGRFGVDVGPWEAVLDRALSLRAADRHPNAAELVADLEAHLAAAQSAWRAGREKAHTDPRPTAPTRVSTGDTGERPSDASAPRPGGDTLAGTSQHAPRPPRALPLGGLLAGAAGLALVAAVAWRLGHTPASPSPTPNPAPARGGEVTPTPIPSPSEAPRVEPALAVAVEPHVDPVADAGAPEPGAPVRTTTPTVEPSARPRRPRPSHEGREGLVVE